MCLGNQRLQCQDKKSWSSWCSNSCHVGGNSLWLRSPKEKKKNHPNTPFAFSERVCVYSSCSVSQATSGKRVGSFFLSPKNNKAVIHFCPRVISWDESPGTSLFSASSLGEGLFPKGSVLHVAHSFKKTAQHRMCHMWGHRFPLSLSIGKRKHIYMEPFSKLHGVWLWRGSCPALRPKVLEALSWASGQGCQFQKSWLLHIYD